MLVVEMLLLVAVGGVAVPIVVLCVECIAALMVRRRCRHVPVSAAAAYAASRIDILIPAHNEEQVLGTTLKHLAAEVSSRDRIWVIADNCTDATAQVARDAGARVLERHDPQRRGKGYALDFALRRLAHDHGEVVVIIDADCRLSPGSLESMTALAVSTQRPVQASYAMHVGESHRPSDVVSQLAVLVKNVVRPLGLARLGVPCLLTGSGMAFPWTVIQSVNLATGDIVEDMKLGIDLLVAGHAPLFCPEALVSAPLPTKREAVVSQRTRWEHGHLQTIASQVPRLVWAAVAKRRPRLLGTALDLAVPPLSLLVLAWAGVAAAAMIDGVARGAWLPALLCAGNGVLLMGTMLAVNRAFNDRSSWRTMASVPMYVIGKMPIYAGFVRSRQTNWVRTAR